MSTYPFLKLVMLGGQMDDEIVVGGEHLVAQKAGEQRSSGVGKPVERIISHYRKYIQEHFGAVFQNLSPVHYKFCFGGKRISTLRTFLLFFALKVFFRC